MHFIRKALGLAISRLGSLKGFTRHRNPDLTALLATIWLHKNTVKFHPAEYL